jgi:hypothetical protein
MVIIQDKTPKEPFTQNEGTSVQRTKAGLWAVQVRH